jgi:hypothetical protein
MTTYSKYLENSEILQSNYIFKSIGNYHKVILNDREFIEKEAFLPPPITGLSLETFVFENEYFEEIGVVISNSNKTQTFVSYWIPRDIDYPVLSIDLLYYPKNQSRSTINLVSRSTEYINLKPFLKIKKSHPSFAQEISENLMPNNLLNEAFMYGHHNNNVILLKILPKVVNRYLLTYTDILNNKYYNKIIKNTKRFNNPAYGTQDVFLV